MQRQAQRLQLRRPEAPPAVPANCAIAALLCLEKRCEVGLELQLASEEGGAVRVVPRGPGVAPGSRPSVSPISGWCCPQRPFVPVKRGTCPSGAAKTASEIRRHLPVFRRAGGAAKLADTLHFSPLFGATSGFVDRDAFNGFNEQPIGRPDDI